MWTKRSSTIHKVSNSDLNSGGLSSELHTSFVLGQPPPLAGSLSIANVMENDDNQEERWRLDDHKLKRLVQYYFPATLESPTRSQTIWLSNAKVVYGAEMTVNLLGYKKVEVSINRTKNNMFKRYFLLGMSKRTLISKFLMAFMVWASTKSPQTIKYKIKVNMFFATAVDSNHFSPLVPCQMETGCRN